MQLHWIDLSIILIFFLISLGIGLYFRKEGGKDLKSFFLGGRNLPWYIAGTSMVATTFAADTPLAVTELVAQSGIAGNWLWWNMLAGGMLTTFFFARYWRRANILTDVELVSIRYGGRPAIFLRRFKALYMGLFMNALIIAWVNLALMSLLKVFFDIPDGQLIYFVAGAMLLVVAYSSISGLLGVVFTDVLQFTIAMIGCIILSVIVVQSPEIGGLSGLKTQLPEWSLSFFPKISFENGLMDTGMTLTLGLGSFLAFTTMQWWASWYPGNEPGGGGYVAQRMMSAKSEKDAIFATLFFQIAHYCIRPWPWILVALAALILYPDLAAEDKKLGYVMAMKDFLPVGLKGLLLVAFFAAYMSTISTQLNWGTSYLINDFIKSFLPKDASEKTQVNYGRVATLLMMLIALGVTTQINSIAGVWQFLVECGAGLGMVLILRWYWWRINAWSEIVATLAPFIGYAIAHFYLQWTFPNSFFFTISFTTMAWMQATWLTKPEENELLQAFHDRVKPAGAWGDFAKDTANQHSLGLLALTWISSILLAYSILFAIGYTLFAEWISLSYCLLTIGVSWWVFWKTSKKVKIFAD